MAALGFTINTLTLLAMVLAVGLVVDDAIVMLENIARYVEQGMKPFDAALKGSAEIGFAVVAMTFTLAAVYVPVALQTGRTGRLFVEFALTLAATVLVSGFVALTLTPMMCSKLLKVNQHHGAAYRFGERVLEGLTRAYRASLRAALSARTIVLAVGLLAGMSSWTFLQVLRSELSPTEDRGFVISIAIAPEGATLDYTARYLEQLEAAMAARPEIARYFAVAGFPVVSQAIMFAGLVPWEERSVKQQQVTAALFGPYFANPGVLAFPVNPPSLGQRATERPVNLVLQTTGPYSELQAAVDAVMAEARTYPGLLNLDTDLRLNKPQLRVVVDRDKVQSLGISEEQIARTLETMLGGRKVTQFKFNGKQYEVVVQVDKPDRSQPSDLRGIYVRANDGTLVQLSNVVRIDETVAPRELNHFNKLRSASITATPAPGFTQGDGLSYLVGVANRVLPPGVQYDFDGQSREFRSTSQGLVLTFVLALFFIYLVLAAQFESFIHPFTIMLSVPLAISGALLALWLTGQTLNVYSQIGLVTLIGLITKNGILIVEFANQLREQGRATFEAVEEAASLRLRPILMTTLATILGALPLATAVGAGAESRQAIGWVIVGGMGFGTLFTLYVVPVVYTLLAGSRPAAQAHGVAQAAE
jgi:multidrug efflux pump